MMPAAPIPCSTRAAVSATIESARAQVSEATVKTASPYI